MWEYPKRVLLIIINYYQYNRLLQQRNTLLKEYHGKQNIPLDECGCTTYGYGGFHRQKTDGKSKENQFAYRFDES